MAKYIPPKQGRAMQFVDVAFLVAAIFITLWVPIQFGLAEPEQVLHEIESPTWENLGQNDAMIAVWDKLEIPLVSEDPEATSAYQVIQNRFDYSIDYLQLIIMAIALIGYFIFMFKASEAEYKEVIDEKFNGRQGG